MSCIRVPSRAIFRLPLGLCTFVILILVALHYEYHYAAVSQYAGQEQSLLMRLATHAQPMPFVAYSDPPFGPVGLRDDLYFFPIPSADGQSLALMTWWQMHSVDVWPLQHGAEVWCRGDLDTEWSLAVPKRDQLDPQKYILFLECQARGDFATLQLRTPNAGSKSLMIPLQSIRPRKLGKGAAGPHVVAMTMLSGFDLGIPAWVEYHVLHGVSEIYIYENTYDNVDSTLRAYLEPYITRGIVIIVPFYKVLLDTYAPGWIAQQLVAVNHIVRSMDGYADWLLLSDIDELPAFTPPSETSPPTLPMFQYSDHLDAAMAEDPSIREFSMLNCFTSRQPWIPPLEPNTTDEERTTMLPTTSQTLLSPVPAPTKRLLDLPQIGQVELLPDEVHRFVSCNGHNYRSKVFVRPHLITVESIHHSPAGNGTDNVQDPASGLWIMHLSNHNTETTGAQIEIDMSQVSTKVTEGLLSRYEGSSVVSDMTIDRARAGLSS